MYCSRCGSQNVEVVFEDFDENDEFFIISTRSVEMHNASNDEEFNTDFVGNLKICHCRNCNHTFFEDDI